MQEKEFLATVNGRCLPDIEAVRQNCLRQCESPLPHRKVPLVRRLLPVAACVAVALAAALAFPQFRPPAVTPATTTLAAAELYAIPPWKEKSLAQQYPVVQWRQSEYNAASESRIPTEQIGEFLLRTSTTGYDDSTTESPAHKTTCEIHAIRSVATACAVAVQFPGTGFWLPYINTAYQPGTLGDFIEDLNLAENLVFNNRIDCADWQGESFIQAEYSLPDPAVLWSLLFGDTELKNVAATHEDADLAIMTCSVDVPGVGQRNIAVSVTENGYLTTNILCTEKAFFIGKEAVDAFVAYIRANGTKRIPEPEQNGVDVPE